MLNFSIYTVVGKICDCSRTTVWTVLKRVDAIGIGLDELNGMSEKNSFICFSRKG